MAKLPGVNDTPPPVTNSTFNGRRPGSFASRPVPFNRILWLARNAVLGFATLLLAGCVGTTTRTVDSTILEIIGEVTVQSEVAPSAMTPLDINSRLPPGSAVRTAAHSTASLTLLPGALLELQPSSDFRLEELKFTKKGNLTEQSISRRIIADLKEGTALLLVQFESEAGEFQIQLAGATVQITSPTLCLLNTAGSQLRLICLRGNVRVIGADRAAAVDVEAGSVYTSRSEGNSVFAAELNSEAQTEIDNSLNLERKLLGLQDRVRKSPFYRRRSSRSTPPGIKNLSPRKLHSETPLRLPPRACTAQLPFARALFGSPPPLSHIFSDDGHARK